MRHGPAARILVTAALAVAAIYFLVPAYWLLVAATKGPGELASTPPLGLGKSFDLVGNIRKLFSYHDGLFLRWIANTMLYAGVGALIATLLATATGYALAKFRFRGREALFTVVLAGVLVPTTALALPSYLLLSKVGLTNTYPGVLLLSVVSPFGVFLSRIYAAASVPDEILEAARIDGAGEFRTFFRISLPLLAPAMVTVFLFQLVAIWNNFLLPLVVLSDQRLYPVTLGLYTLSTNARYPDLQSLTIVGSLVATLPLVVAFLSLQRFWRSGLAAGSVK
ncbi:carbohydrate ABC transporter permease [Kitasatospora paracochleata]|uniref:Multiple sugar transport system permease protein n=1 Tax=Kitasatospora paracochleata TaxID=58354 RepID=A0ABT1J9R5_9ACTN|nr:carbohydrate ABC transporter permease [Kitasatospora paracochleata]MCP2314197.1 multiple sugar transport system permease protein [Kitasatospora paracochleata]